MEFKVPKHNTPAATLIKNYQNRKSGKVTVSRREIQQRFNGMEWRHQKKILLAFINAGAADREWASRKMFAFWDNSFIPVVKSFWEKYHEMPLSWLILRYFPKDYLKQNLDSLSQGRNYYYLCQRLIDEEDFHLDKNRLYESDIIELFKISKKKVTDEEIADVFFSMLRKICRGEYKSAYMYDWDNDYSSRYGWSILVNIKVRYILSEIEFSLSRKGLADAIHMWNRKIAKEVKESNEYRIIRQMEIQGQNMQPEYHDLTKKYSLKHLGLYDIDKENELNPLLDNRIIVPKLDLVSQYSILNNMKIENPAIEKLVNSFNLELLEQVPF